MEENIKKSEMSGSNRIINDRIKKIEILRSKGVDPYPSGFRRENIISEAKNTFTKLEDESSNSNVETENFVLSGRVMSLRIMGKATFFDIQDKSGKIQCFGRENNLGEKYEIFQYLDIGDIVGVTGPIGRTRRGEISVQLKDLILLTKSIRPLPDKWSGLRDIEMRYRQRYLDLISNQKAYSNAIIRPEIIKSIREFMSKRGFIEVETPILVPVAAGAQARPFQTFHNSLDRNLYLRIATELYLKKLIVGGIEKVFEIGRLFRNEGIDHYHNPEFTTMESYESFVGYNEVMEMVEELVSYVAKQITGSYILPEIEGMRPEINLTPPWPRLNLREILIKNTGTDFFENRDLNFIKSKMADMNIHVEPKASWARLLDKVISEKIEGSLIQPSFLIDYPVEMSPLAKRKKGEDGIVERFEAFVLGSELANAFTELNDPIDQRKRFEDQEKNRIEFGDDEADRLDEDFLISIEHGMPPTGGLGIGIDRLVMLICGEESIREVLLFPQLRS